MYINGHCESEQVEHWLVCSYCKELFAIAWEWHRLTQLTQILVDLILSLHEGASHTHTHTYTLTQFNPLPLYATVLAAGSRLK